MSCTSLTSIIPSCITSGSVRTRSPSSERWTTFSCTIPVGSWCSENHGNSLVGSPGGTPWDWEAILGKIYKAWNESLLVSNALAFSRDDQQNLSSRCVEKRQKNVVSLLSFSIPTYQLLGWWSIFHQSKNVVSSIIPTYPNYTGMMMIPVCEVESISPSAPSGSKHLTESKKIQTDR